MWCVIGIIWACSGSRENGRRSQREMGEGGGAGESTLFVRCQPRTFALYPIFRFPPRANCLVCVLLLCSRDSVRPQVANNSTPTVNPLPPGPDRNGAARQAVCSIWAQLWVSRHVRAGPKACRRCRQDPGSSYRVRVPPPRCKLQQTSPTQNMTDAKEC